LFIKHRLVILKTNLCWLLNCLEIITASIFEGDIAMFVRRRAAIRQAITSRFQQQRTQPLTLMVLAFCLTASSSYAQTNLGASASVTNPQRTGDATTGLFSSAAGAVSVSSAGTEVMRVNGTGVGVGTTSPNFPVDMYNNGTDTGFGLAQGEVYSSSFEAGLLFNNTATSGQKYIIFSSGGGSGVGNGKFVFADVTHSAARITISSSGNVGIGTTAPLSLLSVAGNAAIGAYGGGTGAIAAPSNGVIVSGSVGIGTNAPLYKLDVRGTAGLTLASNQMPVINEIVVQKFTASGTYTPTAGAQYALVEAVGGGAGGGGSDSGTAPNAGAAGGGGAGGYCRKLFSAPTSQTVTIGGGGTGGAAGTNSGNPGVATTFGTLLTASGGTGGSGSGHANLPNGGGPGGAGGSATGGDVNMTGGAGWTGIIFGSTSTAVSGAGGTSFYGVGGASVREGQTGIAGSSFGSGGSGGAASSTNEGGGNGAGGLVIVTEYISN
jgi:hypothetical protein